MGLLGSIGSVVGGFTGMPWLSAIGSGLDSFIDKRSSAQGQEDANAFNAQQAQMNRDFQERMRATQYQTTVEDLKKAGLNPMLAYTQGGAGTPGGSTAAPALNKVAAGVSSAQQSASSAQALASLELNKAQIEQVRAETARIVSETLDNRVNTAFKVAQTKQAEGAGNVSSMKYMLDKAAFQADLQNRQVSAQRAAQDFARESDTFAADVARRKAESTLTQLEIPKSKADADFWKSTGDAPQIVKLLTQLFGMGSSARSFLRR